MRFVILVILGILLGGSAPAQGSDLLVDPGGSPGSFATIDAAMQAATPGDRILVMPGAYPPFNFSRGVHLIGLGATPGDVVIQRIAYHVNIPAADYDTLISNVTVTSTSPLDVLSIHGNELAPGTLTIDGCVLQNGVFLRGGQQGFYLFINNSYIAPPAGHGFSGEACYVGGPGNYVDIRNTRIIGWDADPQTGIPAGTALSIAAGTVARITGSEISGGHGQPGGPTVAAGATALRSLPSGTIDLTLDGNAMVVGGNGQSGAPGGHGAAIQGTIKAGAAVVLGGSGTPPGVPYPNAAPLPAPTVHLNLTPGLLFAQNGVSVGPGDVVSVSLGGSPISGAIGISPAVVLPNDPVFVSLPPSTLTVLPVTSFTVSIPQVPGVNGAGYMVYMQGIALDASGVWRISDAAALRIDF